MQLAVRSWTFSTTSTSTQTRNESKTRGCGTHCDEFDAVAIKS